MIKHLEIKTYEFYDIKVMVQIDYDRSTISLVEKQEGKRTCISPTCAATIVGKHYKFWGRELEYMNGWRNVLHAMEYAIGEAEKELNEYLKQVAKEKTDLVTDVLMKATDIVKGRKLKHKKLKS